MEEFSMKTKLTIMRTGTNSKQRFQMAELTEDGIIPFAKHKAYTATDISNTIDNMVRLEPDKYEAAYGNIR